MAIAITFGIDAYSILHTDAPERTHRITDTGIVKLTHHERTGAQVHVVGSAEQVTLWFVRCLGNGIGRRMIQHPETSRVGESC